MSSNNLGRVQGGGFFGSTSTNTASITKTTVQTNGVSPLVGDTIVNANGDLCKITAITSSAYTVTKYGSIKGATGAKGTNGTNGTNGKDGAAGKDGADGATWTSGTSVPGNSSGSEGDFYLNTATWDVYKKGTSSWSKIGNIKGTTGDKGEPGDQGYDLVIKSQEDFDNWCDELNNGAFDGQSVLIIGGGGRGRKGEYFGNYKKPIMLPDTCHILRGVGNVVISFEWNMSGPDVSLPVKCIYSEHEVAPESDSYCIEGITVEADFSCYDQGWSVVCFYGLKNVINCTARARTYYESPAQDSAVGFEYCENLVNCKATTESVYTSSGFVYCINLVNCTAEANGGRSAHGFNYCENLANCRGQGTGAEDSSHSAFYSCSYCSNCRAGTEQVADYIWGGATLSRDDDSCDVY